MDKNNPEYARIRDAVAKKVYEFTAASYRNEDNWKETSWESLKESDKDFYREYAADQILSIKGLEIKGKSNGLI